MDFHKLLGPVGAKQFSPPTFNHTLEKPAAQIYVEDGKGRGVEISTISDAVATLKEKYQLVRYYFPERYRDGIRAIAAPLMKK
jgi:hypothetical protein